MCDYSSQKEIRIRRFDRYLQEMVRRRRDERKSDCFATFMEEPPDGLPLDELEAAKALSPELVIADSVDFDGGGGQPADQTISVPQNPLEGDGIRGSEPKSDRYLQFVFMKRTFYMDLPNNTLFAAEAQRLFRERSGFFWVHDRRWWFQTMESWQSLVSTLDPVNKEYLNTDTRSAAEDMAYILYRLWRFPQDWQFYVRANRFEGRKLRDWEGEKPF